MFIPSITTFGATNQDSPLGIGIIGWVQMTTNSSVVQVFAKSCNETAFALEIQT